MKHRIIFATGNEGKMREVRLILADLGMDILSMKEAGICCQVTENGSTFGENATVTVCHTRTASLESECRNGQILVAAAGKARMVTKDMVGEGAVVVDVGINVDEEGSLCGDVDFEAVEHKASYITPVPGGVGSVTSSVLAKHVLKSAGMR